VDPLLWKRIGELFAAARPLDEESRIAFLKDKCGQDHDLFEQVKCLLDVDGKSGLLNSAPTVSTVTVPQVIAGRFRIIRYIAEGGMGTVYEAEDLTLNDRVALKTIRSDIALDPKAVERFKREILLGKKVTHPNVCRIHDLGVYRSEAGVEVLFLTMQFLSGETLASRVQRGPTPKTEALPLIEDMADALSAAHQAEVIHRDFKSGNVMLVKRANRHCAVVTDFGLARGIHANRSQTHAGIVGTVDYMAPEQIRNEEITPAADIYALGVVMYEMATGQRPFTGDSNVTVALKHLNEDPRPPRDFAPNLDPIWNETILACLRKSPHERFQSAAEVKAALIQDGARSSKRFQRSPSSKAMTAKRIGLSFVFSVTLLILWSVPSIRSKAKEWLHLVSVPHAGQLAVIPLTMSANDPQGAALEYGLADTLATRLTQITGRRPLQIVPATEIRAKGVTTLEGARQEFGVNLGLELSLYRSGEMVRVNYALVDAQTHDQLRGDTITAPFTDGFAIEDKVADSVVKAMEIDVQPDEKQFLAGHGTDEPAAYDHYLEGRGYLQEFQKPENVANAITAFRRALELDPQYALAYSGLGEAYWRTYEQDNDNHWADDALGACAKSVLLDTHHAGPHICLGLVYNGTGRYQEAVDQYKMAVDLEPTNDDAIRGLASAYQSRGSTSDAEKTYKSAIAARPTYWLGYNALGSFYMAVGRYAEAAEMFTRVTTLAPDSFRGYSNLGGAFVLLDRYTEAVTMFQRSIQIRPTYAAYSNLATAYFRLQQYANSAESYHQALAINDQDYVVWGNLGDAYLYSGKRLEAQKAYEKALSLAKMRLKVNPRDASVLGDLAVYYSMVGNRQEAFSYVTRALQQSGYSDPDLLFAVAMVHNEFGETSQAVDWLAKALAAGYSARTVLVAPTFNNLHSDPRFQSLLKTANGNHN
jgi:serine/threonine protein kinase/tetratricopeptide (TPR) repeat protein